MGYEFVSGDGLPLSVLAPLGKIRKKPMGISTYHDVSQQRDVEHLWAILWLFAELRNVSERSSRVDAAERA